MNEEEKARIVAATEMLQERITRHDEIRNRAKAAEQRAADLSDQADQLRDEATALRHEADSCSWFVRTFTRRPIDLYVAASRKSTEASMVKIESTMAIFESNSLNRAALQVLEEEWVIEPKSDEAA